MSWVTFRPRSLSPRNDRTDTLRISPTLATTAPSRSRTDRPLKVKPSGHTRVGENEDSSGDAGPGFPRTFRQPYRSTSSPAIWSPPQSVGRGSSCVGNATAFRDVPPDSTFCFPCSPHAQSIRSRTARRAEEHMPDMAANRNVSSVCQHGEEGTRKKGDPQGVSERVASLQLLWGYSCAWNRRHSNHHLLSFTACPVRLSTTSLSPNGSCS